MYTVTVGADPRVRPEYHVVTAHVNVLRADAGVRPYCCCIHFKVVFFCMPEPPCQSIMSNPQYGTRAAGMRMPSGV